MDRIAENAMPLTEESLQAAASSPVNPNPHSTTPSAIQNNSAKKPKSSQKKVKIRTPLGLDAIRFQQLDFIYLLRSLIRPKVQAFAKRPKKQLTKIF